MTFEGLAEKIQSHLSIGNRPVFISDKIGCDVGGDGTQSKPYKSFSKFLSVHGEPDKSIIFFVDSEVEEEKFSEIPKTRLKKILKACAVETKKHAAEKAHEEEKARLREKNLSEAKNVVIELDTSLPIPKKIKISECTNFVGKRIFVQGWVNTIRRQGKSLMFVLLRDGSGHLQCVLSDKMCQVYDALVLTHESSIRVYGVLANVPETKTAPNQVELMVDYWEVVSLAPSDVLVDESSNPDTQLDYKHLLLRSDLHRKIMKVRCRLIRCFREHYFEKGYTEVTPPTLVQTQCEGGATLFKLNFFGKQAYLTQSSQLYLETCLPAAGDVFCVAQSYRAEVSRTRRHVAEYTHIEGEMSFITFDELLDALEDLICDVVGRVMESPEGEIVLELNPEFKTPQKPFVRMQYTEAIQYLNEHGIKKEDGTDFVFGDDIPEAPERRMTDEIGKPILLCRFPLEIKSFYIPKCADNEKLTESVDLLMPGVGEVIGGSMRIWKYDELIKAYEREGLDPGPYYWYTDQRRYGSCPHGGYGLGLERMLTWILNRYHIRDACLYPRFVGRCTP